MVEKIIIDTDPGVDDAMAILLALESPELDVIGLTSIFGNVHVDLASQNALRLLELADRTDIPVAEGASRPMKEEFRGPADFVHGKDGFGNVDHKAPSGKIIDQTACDFIIDQVNKAPGEVSLVPIGPLTNIALAIQKDPSIVSKVKRVVLMGGAVRTAGNVTPVAEANIINDAVAADMVLTAGWDLSLVGLDVTSKVILTGDDLSRLNESSKKFGVFLHDIAQFYLNFYKEHRDTDGMCFHDPSTIAYLIDETLFGTKSGPARVVTEGIAIGQTIVDDDRITRPDHAWTGKPSIKYCETVDAKRLLNLFFDRMM